MHAYSRTALAVSLVWLVAVAAVAWFAPVRAQTVTVPLCEINRTLSIGDSGEDVRCLQRYLNWAGITIAVSGPGSPGNETTYFGVRTADAVARWQNAHAAQVLAPVGLSAGTGVWGPSSFGHYVSMVRVLLGLR